MKHFKIKIDLYQETVHVFFVKDVVKFRNGKLIKKFNKLHKLDDTGKCYGLHTYSPNYVNKKFITLVNKADWGVITHECFHCAKCILDSKDIDDEEALAYTLEYLISNLQNKLS